MLTDDGRFASVRAKAIAVTDGLKGMSGALAAVFPQNTLQTCIVHLIRYSLGFANWKVRKVAALVTGTGGQR